VKRYEGPILQTCHIFLITNYLTPWSIVHVEKLKVTQPVKKFPTFYRTQRFITRACQWTLSWVRHIQSTPSHPICVKIQSNIIFTSMPRSSKLSLPFSLTDQNFVWISHLSHACNMACQSHPPWLHHPNYIQWKVPLTTSSSYRTHSSSLHFLALL
jgi:hypothetical protein